MQETTTRVEMADGAQLAVTVWSESDANAAGRDVLLVHGWPNAARVWRPLAEALLLAGRCRLVVPDLRGFGDSNQIESGFTCEQFADDVARVAAALDLNDYALVGHSMGGKIAQLVAAQTPPGLARLILVAPTPLIATPVPESKKAAQRAARGDADKTRALIAGMAAHPLESAMLDALIEDGLRAAPAAWNGWLDPMREEDFADALGRIAVPTLVVGGGRDPLRTEEQLRREVVERIVGAEFAAVPPAGHLVHLEETEALASLVVNFLDPAN